MLGFHELRVMKMSFVRTFALIGMEWKLLGWSRSNEEVMDSVS